MFTKNKTAITYYSGAVIMSLAFCLALITTVEWPFLAEFPLAASIFIQLLAVAKSFYSFVNEGESESLQEVYSRLKGGIFDLQRGEHSGVSEN